MSGYLIADEKLGYWLKRILPHVYHLHFEDPYQLAMHFLRAQEFYESPKFADKIFTLVEYMEWYAKEHGNGVFDYMKTWSGFNVPSWALLGVFCSELPDKNKYDILMEAILARHILPAEKKDWREILAAAPRNTCSPTYDTAEYLKAIEHPFYLIGTSSKGYKGDEDEESVLDHEIAHALYETDKGYKKDVEVLLSSLGKDKYLQENPYYLAWHTLAKEGYHERTIRDEIHAYASTGAHAFGLEKILTKQVCRPFEENFKKHKKRLLGKGS